MGDRQCPVVVDCSKASRGAARGLGAQRTENCVPSFRRRLGAVKPRLGLEAFVASRLADHSQASVRKERGELCRAWTAYVAGIAQALKLVGPLAHRPCLDHQVDQGN